MKKCINCGTISDSKFCPNCGNPMPSDDLEEIKNYEPIDNFKAAYINEQPINQKQRSNRGTIIVAIALAVILIIAIALGVSYFNDKKEMEFIESLQTFGDEVNNSAVTAEEQCNLISSVWNDAIWEQPSSETEKYVTGASDFNDALNNLFADGDFIAKNDSIEASRDIVEECVDQMGDTPRGFEDCYDAVLDLYSTYIDFTDLALYPSGSYDSYTDDFNRLGIEYVKQYGKALKELEKLVE